MKTIRLDAQLQAYLDQAVFLTGEPPSKIVREAIIAYCTAIREKKSTLERLADVIGIGSSDKLYADRTEEAFGEVLLEKQAAKNK